MQVGLGHSKGWIRVALCTMGAGQSTEQVGQKIYKLARTNGVAELQVRVVCNCLVTVSAFPVTVPGSKDP